MLLPVLVLACAEPAADTVVDLTVDPAPPDHGYQLVTEPFLVEPYSEVEMCTIVMLEPDGDEVLTWVDTMETLISPASHHMNVFIGQFSFLDAFLGEGASADALGHPVGQVLCDDLDVMESAFPVFPSQRENQQITMPEGVAVPVILPSLYIFNHHYVNPSEDTVRVNAALNLETVAADRVEDVAALVFDSIDDLSIVPGSGVAHRTCQMERDLNVALVSTHTHEWGTCAALNHWNGEQVETEPFYVNQSWEVPPILHFGRGAFEISAGEGIHYACHYDNDTDRTLVNDGTSEGEMCVFASVVYPAALSVEEVEEIVAGGDLGGLVELLDDALGSCDTRLETETPWDAQSCEGYAQTESNTLR